MTAKSLAAVASPLHESALDDYHIGPLLGKGASGQVFRALNFTSGRAVAVKQIQLENIPKAELGEIMSEIDLLKNLKHENIVEYIGFVKTKEFLYIILEYCENGSLHGICKTFGKFPENLVAVYIYQVLKGLIYLHDQGVIHRDIKGANILTNKDGCVKLADFGVATNPAGGAVSDAAVVGSPYWMAPEIIEQAGASTASDIWSVGCVVIELLEGKPPYSNLVPMQALFRIVKDETPPIPVGASESVKSFLLSCFQKDPNLRISAKKLMKHPWMVSARKQMESQGRESTLTGDDTVGKEVGKPDVLAAGNDAVKRTRRGGSGPRPLSNHDAIQRVQEWNEKLEKEYVTPKPDSSKIPRSTAFHPKQFPPLYPRPQGGLTPSTSFNSSLSVSASSRHGSPLVSVPTPMLALEKVDRAAQLRQMEESQEFADNWDDDFAEGITSEKIETQKHAIVEERKEGDVHHQPRHHQLEEVGEDEKEDTQQWNTKTIMPSKSPVSPPRGLPVAEIEEGVEDWSDFVPNNSLSGLAQKVAQLSSKRGLYHPDDIKNYPSFSGSVSTLSSVSVPSTPTTSAAILRRPPRSPSPGMNSPKSMSRSSSFGKAADPMLRKYSEDTEEEDYDDVFGKGPVNGNGTNPTLQLTNRLTSRAWLGDDESDEIDPFAEIEEDYVDVDLETNLARDKHARLCAKVDSLIDDLQPNAPDSTLRYVCDQLLLHLTEQPELQSQMVSSHGMLAILEVLEAGPSRDVVLRMLRLINMIIFQDIEMLENFCLVGGIPVVMTYTSKRYSSECRLEAANFVSSLCNASVQTLQMFISCRGLKVLVELLDEDYSQHRDLVISALGGIGSVFQLQSTTPRNDFCRMFVREGLSEPLAAALVHIVKDKDEGADEAKEQILAVFLLFCQVSQSDSRVRESLSTRNIFRRVFRACEHLEPYLLVTHLKSIKHLSTNTSTLEVLQNANAMENLVQILNAHITGPHSTDICNHVLQTLFNLCRLNKSRQEEAAQAGIIPDLKRIVEKSSPLKEFALPILLDLANAGKSTRDLLWKYDGLQMYLKLLADPFWRSDALEAVYLWLQEETARVEDVLVQPLSLQSMMDCFVAAESTSFENILDPFHRILRLSSQVSVGISRSPFFKRLVERLGKNNKAVIRLNLLRITKTVAESHPDRATLVKKYGLYETVERLSRQDGAILVRELAKEILPTLLYGARTAQHFTHHPKSRRTPSRSPSESAIIPSASRSSHSQLPSKHSQSAFAVPPPPSSPTISQSPFIPTVVPKPQHRRVPSRSQLSDIEWTDDGRRVGISTPPVAPRRR